jgi:hypothetical protein
MLKAYLLNSTRYLNGVGAGGDLPSDAQGWGLPDLATAFDSVPRFFIDQSVLLDHSGQVYERTGLVSDASKPFRVTLAWTDAPGISTAAAWVNDLDLEVIVGGQTYKGNVLSGAQSIPGGVADAKNNVESVLLPAGVSGPFTVRVVAYTVAGDGVPGNDDGTDQDFALVVYNAVPEPDFGLSAVPDYAEVCGAAEAAYTVSVTGLHGYAHPVTLMHSLPPAHVDLTFSPASGTPNFNATLRATTNVSTAVGLYSPLITGTGEDTRAHATAITLTVDTVPPTGALSLISPSDNMTNVAVQPALTWSPLVHARSYRVQISGDRAFTQLVVDDPVHDTAYFPSPLLEDTTYYWRVIAQNGCGNQPSLTRVFTTINQVRLFYDALEAGTGQWTVETALGTARWMLSDRLVHSGSYAWHMPHASQPTDARLTMAWPIVVDKTSTLSFWHWYDMELAGALAGDGGVAEISVDGGNWSDLGPYITSGGYDHTVAGGLDNPLAGRSAWSGSTENWRYVEIDLSNFAGSAIRIRFRWGGNGNSTTNRGWYIDDVQIVSVWPPSKHKLYMSTIFKNGQW